MAKEMEVMRYALPYRFSSCFACRPCDTQMMQVFLSSLRPSEVARPQTADTAGALLLAETIAMHSGG
jgi:hypothetical protein